MNMKNTYLILTFFSLVIVGQLSAEEIISKNKQDISQTKPADEHFPEYKKPADERFPEYKKPADERFPEYKKPALTKDFSNCTKDLADEISCPEGVYKFVGGKTGDKIKSSLKRYPKEMMGKPLPGNLDDQIRMEGSSSIGK